MAHRMTGLVLLCVSAFSVTFSTVLMVLMIFVGLQGVPERTQRLPHADPTIPKPVLPKPVVRPHVRTIDV